MNQIQHDELKEFEYTLWRAYQAFANTNAMIMGDRKNGLIDLPKFASSVLITNIINIGRAFV